MPVPFREWLLARGIELVEVPDAEFESMGRNVLAIAPRRCLLLEGNPETRRRLEAAGARVEVIAGADISMKGQDGPTCLTRPLARARPGSADCQEGRNLSKNRGDDRANAILVCLKLFIYFLQ